MTPIQRLLATIDRHPTLADFALAAAIGVLSLLNIWLEWSSALPSPPVTVPLAVGLTLFLTLPLTWRRRFPLAVLLTMTVASALSSLAGVPDSLWSGNAWGLALYSAGVYGSDRWRDPVRAVAVAGFTGLIAYEIVWANLPEYAGSPLLLRIVPVLSNVVITASIYWFSDAVRIRREREAQLAARTAQLEQEREENARRAVLEERVCIARELHDVVAHHVSLMGVQAGAARRVLHRQPEKAEEVLSAIEATGREAVRELHRLLGFLRREGEDGLAPQPSMRQLDALITQMGEAGLPVVLTVEGEPRPLPPGVDLSAYRIVQEALTNTLKHAGPAKAEVTVRYGDRALEIEVTDDGRQKMNGIPAGNGMIGMRERVSLLGGELQAGPRAGAGFAVRAQLPLNGDSPLQRRGAWGGGPA
jgi:signal transduction histidine kinase